MTGRFCGRPIIPFIPQKQPKKIKFFVPVLRFETFYM